MSPRMVGSRYMEKVARHAAERLTLKPGARPADSLALFKKFLKVEEHRLRLWHRSGASGRQIVRARAQVIDLILHRLFTAAEQHYRPQHPAAAAGALTLVAIGGYGRAELSPHSDIDIMFLHDRPARRGADHSPYVKAVVEEILYLLWDIGLKLGHSTRTVAEAVTQANSDMQSKTSLIESRRLAGDAALYAEFREALVKKCVHGHADEYIAARVRDQQERHDKFGDSVYLQEPNVKNGCGGLRDFQNLIWMAFFKAGAQTLADLRKQKFLEAAEQRQLDEAYDFILRVRNELHDRAGRAADTITLALQPQVATALGYRQHDLLRRTEAFMRDYYTHSRTVFLLTNTLAERLALRPPRFPKLEAWWGRGRKPETLDGFIITGNVLSASAPVVWAADPLRLLRVFLHLQQRNLEPSPELRQQLHQHARLINRGLQTAAAARAVFCEILQQKGQVARILRLMHETGVLGKYLPEFGRLTCLVQHEFFHRYTADEHTLQVVEHLDRIIDATRPPHASYKRLFQELDQPHVLYLAVLLHDVGKAANAERHAEASLEMARRAAARLKLGPDETSRLLFLVRDHLKLSLLSQRRDLDDQATIDAAARIVKTETNLDMLHLLTFADAAGTSIKTWSDWKEALLWELYHRTRQTLTGAERAKNILARRIEQLYKEVSARLAQRLPLEEIYSHFELMPASYYINTSADEIAQHLQLIHQFLARQLEVETPAEALAPAIDWRPLAAQGYSQLAICTWDRLGLFSKICGAFASAELNVLRGRIYTRGDHVVLDVFDVCDRDHRAVTEDRLIQAAETALRRALTHEEHVDFQEILQRLRAGRRPTPRIREVMIPTVIEFDNEISQSRTVVEIQTEDRLGLLYALTHTLTDLSLDISIAKIATEKGAAIDTFYIQDHAGQKITDPQRLKTIKAKLESALDLLAG